MYKIIATDFDDTILNDKKRINDKSKEYLLNIRKKGYIVVGVTGRNFNSVCDTESNDIFDYLILNNGCDIYDSKLNKNESVFSLDKDIVNSIVSKYRSDTFKIDCCTSSTYYSITDSRLLANKSFIVKVDSPSQIRENICRLNIFLNDSTNIIKIRDEINKLGDLSCFIMQDSTDVRQWLVVMPKGVNKSSTLELLCKRLGYSLNDVIFFGDGLNDIELMKNSGFGVAMGNALEEVKMVSDDVTLTNLEDGVIKYLNKIIK